MTIFTSPLLAALIQWGGMPAFPAGVLVSAAAPAPVVAAPVTAVPVAEPEAAEPFTIPAREAAPVIVPVQAAPAAEAETPAAVQVPPAAIAPAPMSDEEIISRARAALESVETARGRFTQYNPDGSVATGSYAIRRPGRVRFDYDDPVPMLIVADGATLAIEDSELKSVDRYPLASTPLAAILSNDGSFDGSATITRVRQSDELAAITVVDPKGEYEGELSLVFTKSAWELVRWETVDGLGAYTSVILEGTETGVRLDPRLFVLRDERDTRDRDERR